MQLLALVELYEQHLSPKHWSLIVWIFRCLSTTLKTYLKPNLTPYISFLTHHLHFVNNSTFRTDLIHLISDVLALHEQVIESVVPFVMEMVREGSGEALGVLVNMD